MSRSPKPQPALLLLLGVAALALLAWLPLFADGERDEDFHGHVAELRVLAELRAGDGPLPLWNSREYAGSSLVPAYLHPIATLSVLAPFAALLGPERGLEAGAFVFLGLSVFSMFLWCRHLSASVLGAALGAFFYVLSPSVFAYVGDSGHMHQPVTLALFPLVFLAWVRLAEAPGFARTLVAATASAALLLDMQRFFLAMPIVGLVYAAAALARDDGRRAGSRLGTALLAAAGVALGVLLLACFPILPMAQERAQLAWHGPGAAEWRAALSVAHLLELVNRAGGLRPWLMPLRAVTSTGLWYQGSVILVFVGVGALLAARGGRDPVWRLRLGVTLACVGLVAVLSFGPTTLLERHLALAREALAAGPSGLVVLLLCVVAVVAWASAFLWLRAALVERWPHARRWVDAGVVTLAVGLAVVSPFELLAHLVFVYERIRAPTHFAFPLLPFLLASAAALVLPVWQRALASPRRVALLLAVVVGLHGLDIAPYLARTAPPQPARVGAALRAAFDRIAEGPPGRVLDVAAYSPLVDRLIVERTRRANAWGWLAWTATRHTAELVRGFSGAFFRGDYESAAALAGLANVRYLVALTENKVPLPSADAWVPVVSDARVSIAENLRALPYVQFYREIAWLSGSPWRLLPQLAGLGQGGIAAYTFEPGVVEEPPLTAPDYAFGARARRAAPQRPWPPSHPPEVDSTAPCELARPRPSRIELRCAFVSSGHLVVAESWSPRWQATVDGEPRRLLRLNHAFQGVAVTPDDRLVVLEYVPSTLTRASLAVSALSVCAALAYGVTSLWRRRKSNLR